MGPFANHGRVILLIQGVAGCFGVLQEFWYNQRLRKGAKGEKGI
jgi:hypothetical protein